MAGNHANLNRIAFTPAASAPAPTTSAFNSHSRGGGPRALGPGSGIGGFGGSSNSEESPSSFVSTSTTPMSGVNTNNGNNGNNVNTNISLPDAADDGGTNGSNTKKRKTAPGSRGVANLTPEQLAKKRANDREAQRAIRERQRLKIEQYEREIRELKSQQPYQELQAAIRQREAVEAELAEVKSCLATIMHLVQPVLAKPSIVGQQHPAPLPSPAPTHHPPPHHQHHGLAAPTPTSLGFSGSGPGSVASPGSVGTHGRWHSSMSPVVAPMNTEGQHQQHQHQPHQPHQLQQPQPSCQAGILTQQRHDLVHGLDLGSDRLGLEFLLDPAQKIARIQQNVAPPTNSHNQCQQQTPLMMIPPTPQDYPPQSHQHHHPSHFNNNKPIDPPTQEEEDFTTLPLNCPPTCPLDSILLDFLSERRHLLSLSERRHLLSLSIPPHHPTHHLTPNEVLGPPYPSISSLLNPSVSSHPLSKVFTDILARFPGLSNLPERVAVLYLMFLLMRWQISPTKQNWDRIPVYFRPGRLQREKAHPAWVDHIPWPGMREYIIQNYDFDDVMVATRNGDDDNDDDDKGNGNGNGGREKRNGFPFENFFIPFTSTLRVGWGYEDEDCLLLSSSFSSTATKRNGGGGGDGTEGGSYHGKDNTPPVGNGGTGGVVVGVEADEIMINPVFERHLGRLDSWSLGEAFERAFPELVGTYKLKR
ncbi:hypothetical protein B0T21DRAFT_452185 [Apiosordaria backusii]|uniref:BZIP transcription factor n=1 Tax=Apiosordaria backusii TaxID=314023 RepID=A0AA40BE72_9PEZI|nr:hypothetical protein B0T21DRAFT_452185 [Apiosordaria backusii]